MKTLVKEIKILNWEEKTFFAISDLHGDYQALMEIEERGFNIKNPNHILIVAGDIIEGKAGKENKVIDYLKLIDSKGRLIAVVGNHDYRYMNSRLDKNECGLKVLYRDGSHMTIDGDNWLFLKSLPIVVKTNLFNIVHGMWSDEAIVDIQTEANQKELLNNSPALMGTVEMEKNYSKSFCFKTIDDHVKKLKAPTLIGHFYKNTFNKDLDFFQEEDGTRKRVEPENLNIEELNNGAFIKGNLICLDNCVSLTRKTDPFVFKITKTKKGKTKLEKVSNYA